MKIITVPTVAVVAHSVFREHPEHKIPSDGDDSLRLGAFAAKGCYGFVGGADGRSNADNQSQIISTRHGSVLEHFNISLYVEGISRACSHEIVRHRAGFGYSQRSTRYTDESSAAIVLDPYYARLYWMAEHDHFLTPEEGHLLGCHIESCQKSFKEYAAQVEELITLNPYGKAGTELRKWARGKARNLLPHALETAMTITGNLRAWRFFIEQRSEHFAEAEIRRLACVVFAKLSEVAPFYFQDFFDAGSYDGITEYSTAWRKV